MRIGEADTIEGFKLFFQNLFPLLCIAWLMVAMAEHKKINKFL
jgi:hypothetical protein